MPQPFTDHSKSWSDVVGQAGDDINGALDRNRQLAAHDAEQNRVLNPDVESVVRKYHGMVESGEMDPVSAAHAYHQEVGTPGYSGPPNVNFNVSGPDSGEAPSNLGGLNGGEKDQGSGFSTSVSPGAPAPVAQAPQAQPAPVAPRPRLTVRDLGDLKSMPPKMNSIDAIEARGNEARKNITAKDAGLNSRATQKIDSTTQIANNTLAFKYFELATKYNLKLTELEAIRQRVHEGIVSNEDINRARVLQSQVNAEIGALAKINSRLGADDSESSLAAQQMHAGLMRRSAEVDQLLGQAPPQPGDEGGPAGPVAPKTPEQKAAIQPAKPKEPAPSGQTVRVLITAGKDKGKTGKVDVAHFDPKTMKKIP